MEELHGDPAQSWSSEATQSPPHAWSFHFICISLLDKLFVYLFLIMTKRENICTNWWFYLFVCFCVDGFYDLDILVWILRVYAYVDIDIGVYLELIMYNVLGDFFNFQRKLCPNFQVLIMHMFRGSFKVKTESFLNLLIGCFVIIKNEEIVEPLLILMIPKHSH